LPWHVNCQGILSGTLDLAIQLEQNPMIGMQKLTNTSQGDRHPLVRLKIELDKIEKDDII